MVLTCSGVIVMVFTGSFSVVTSCIVPGCTVMVVLYSWSGVRDIPWSRVRVMVLACCGVMVMAFTGS